MVGFKLKHEFLTTLNCFISWVIQNLRVLNFIPNWSVCTTWIQLWLQLKILHHVLRVWQVQAWRINSSWGHLLSRGCLLMSSVGPIGIYTLHIVKWSSLLLLITTIIVSIVVWWLQSLLLHVVVLSFSLVSSRLMKFEPFVLVNILLTTSLLGCNTHCLMIFLIHSLLKLRSVINFKLGSFLI